MRELTMSSLSEFQASRVSWLWPGRIPRGKLTMLCGDPGLGKSFLTMDLAAWVTSRLDFPDAASPLREPGSVLILSAEDDPSDTIRPRIEAAGGDVNRVMVVEGVRHRHESGDISRDGVALDRDVEAIEQALSNMERPRLVIVDPISAYMGTTDSHNNSQVRSVLARLAECAMRFGPAIVCVSHLAKSSQQVKAVYRQMGSLAFTAAARIVWQVAKMPGEESKRALLLVKSNLASVSRGLGFEVVDGRVRWDDRPLDLSADEVDMPDEAMAPGARDEAAAFLGQALSEGPVEASEIIARAEQAGISLITLKRAKKSLRVLARRSGGAGRERGWVWSLEDHPGARGDDPLFRAKRGGEAEGDEA